MATLTFDEQQADQLSLDLFVRRVDAVLCREDAVWSAQTPEERRAFVRESLRRARARGLGLVSERGVAAYTLAARWMGPEFEQRSSLLMALLDAQLPEVRRVHGLGEWVHDQLGPQATPASGDAAIRRSFAMTEAWGRSA